MAKVMVFEDDGLLAKMYHRMLEVSGFEVVMIDDGQVGLLQVKTVRPDVILADIMMPGLNGLQVLDTLKKDPTTANIPVIVMTNLSEINTQEEVLAKGAAAYLDKSQTDPKQVAEVVRSVLGGGG